jgi:hypothetical protein
MNQQKFDRESQALPIAYDPTNFQPIRRYRLSRKQLTFLIDIEKFIAGLNPISTPDEIFRDFHFIRKTTKQGFYYKKDIRQLLYIRDEYKQYIKK